MSYISRAKSRRAATLNWSCAISNCLSRSIVSRRNAASEAVAATVSYCAMIAFMLLVLYAFCRTVSIRVSWSAGTAASSARMSPIRLVTLELCSAYISTGSSSLMLAFSTAFMPELLLSTTCLNMRRWSLKFIILGAPYASTCIASACSMALDRFLATAPRPLFNNATVGARPDIEPPAHHIALLRVLSVVASAVVTVCSIVCLFLFKEAFIISKAMLSVTGISIPFLARMPCIAALAFLTLNECSTALLDASLRTCCTAGNTSLLAAITIDFCVYASSTSRTILSSPALSTASENSLEPLAANSVSTSLVAVLVAFMRGFRSAATPNDK